MLGPDRAGAPREERDLIQRIRAAQGDAPAWPTTRTSSWMASTDEGMTLQSPAGTRCTSGSRGSSEIGQDRSREDGQLVGERRPGGMPNPTVHTRPAARRREVDEVLETLNA